MQVVLSLSGQHLPIRVFWGRTDKLSMDLSTWNSGSMTNKWRARNSVPWLWLQGMRFKVVVFPSIWTSVVFSEQRNVGSKWKSTERRLRHVRRLCQLRLRCSRFRAIRDLRVSLERRERRVQLGQRETKATLVQLVQTVQMARKVRKAFKARRVQLVRKVNKA